MGFPKSFAASFVCVVTVALVLFQDPIPQCQIFKDPTPHSHIFKDPTPHCHHLLGNNLERSRNPFQAKEIQIRRQNLILKKEPTCSVSSYHRNQGHQALLDSSRG